VMIPPAWDEMMPPSDAAGSVFVSPPESRQIRSVSAIAMIAS
jgi:hypothetical protein